MLEKWGRASWLPLPDIAPPTWATLEPVAEDERLSVTAVSARLEAALGPDEVAAHRLYVARSHVARKHGRTGPGGQGLDL